MGEAEPFEAGGFDVEARVHRDWVGYGLGRPEAFGDRSVARPDARVDVFGTDVLRPHGRFAAEEKLFLVVGKGGGGPAQGVDGVVASGGPAEVEIVAV